MLVHTDPAEGTPGSRCGQDEMLLPPSARSSEGVVPSPVGKQPLIGAQPAAGQGSQVDWGFLGSPGGFPVIRLRVDFLPQQPGGVQDLLPIITIEALAHKNSCGV